MDHAKATTIAKAYKPDLIIAPQHPDIPHALVVRRREGGDPFNISLPEALERDADSDAQEEKHLKMALDAADGMLPA